MSRQVHIRAAGESKGIYGERLLREVRREIETEEKRRAPMPVADEWEVLMF